VDDAATKDISIDFYKNLKKGFTKDVALRQAKLRHIKSAKSAQKHPFFWAAMIGIGDMGVVR
jgi:CHAT domain-containing protein